MTLSPIALLIVKILAVAIGVYVFGFCLWMFVVTCRDMKNDPEITERNIYKRLMRKSRYRYRGRTDMYGNPY